MSFTKPRWLVYGLATQLRATNVFLWVQWGMGATNLNPIALMTGEIRIRECCTFKHIRLIQNGGALTDYMDETTF